MTSHSGVTGWAAKLISMTEVCCFLPGTYHAQYPGVLVDIVGLGNNEWAMGIAVSLTGIATFVAIPFAGESIKRQAIPMSPFGLIPDHST